MRIRTCLVAAGSVFSVVLATACSSNDAASGQLSVHLTDAPGPYDQVHVTVTEVSVHRAGGGGPSNANAKGGPSNDGSDASDEGGWVTIAIPATTIDLLTLQNGVELPLGTSTVPAGSYDMLRLVVTSADVVVGGATSPLSIPSGAERGIQIRYDFAVDPNDHAQLLLDFNADASIHQEGNGSYSMVPVLDVKSIQHG